VSATVVRWTCPQCGEATSTVVGASSDDAHRVLQGLVRQHLDDVHPGSQANAAALAQWLAGTGQLVQLWAGPHDGGHLYLPPGPLPDVIGVHLTTTGTLYPVRSAVLRLRPDVTTYRLGEPASGRLRYLYDGRGCPPPATAAP
jgi:hypothetical protein